MTDANFDLLKCEKVRGDNCYLSLTWVMYQCILDKTEEDLLESILQEYHRLVRPKGSHGEPATVSVAFSLMAINSLVSYILFL